MNNEVAELQQKVEEIQRQIWILTQGDNWLHKIKTQSLTLGVSAGTYLQDADGDTKVQVEEGADDDTIRLDCGGNEEVVVTDTQLTVNPNADFAAGVDVTGNITVTGTVDGVDIAARDHARLHAITDTSDHSATNWRVFYSDGSAHVIELALGADGTFFQSSGAGTLPEFTALAVADIPYDDGTSDPLAVGDAASDGTESSPARKDHAHALGGTAGGDLGGTYPNPTVDAASTTVAGKVELAIASEINTGSDTTRAMPVDQFVASNRNIRFVTFRLIEAATACAADTTVGGDWVCPFTGTLLQSDTYKNWCSANNDTAGVTGTMVVDVHKGGTTVMTTNKLDIETGEKSTNTATTQPDLTVTAVTAGDVFTFDIDAIHSGTAAKGLSVTLAIRMT